MRARGIETVIGPWTPFLERIFLHLEKLRMDVSPYELDHICYRVDSMERYEKQKSELMNWGRLLTEADVNGRPIASFQLHKPLEFRGRKILVLELPAPKHGKNAIEGLEHIEFAVGEDFEKLTLRYPHLAWIKSGAQKSLNPELQITLEPHLTVKFHPLPLSKVIEIETAGTFRMKK